MRLPVHARKAVAGTFASIGAISSTGPFSWKWPDYVEQFSQGWEFSAELSGVSARVRAALGQHEVFGCSRPHIVVWTGGQVRVEGAGCDDYATSQALLSLLRTPDKRHVRTLADIPPGYEGFTIVNHREEISAPYSPNSLAVKIAVDDLAAWATHAMLRARMSAPARAMSPTIEEEAEGGHRNAPPPVYQSHRDVILALIRRERGLTDAEIRDRTGIQPVNQVNQICNRLAKEGLITRQRGDRGFFVNVPAEAALPPATPPSGGTPSIAEVVSRPTSSDTVVGSWRLVQLLGNGSFGVVWLGVHVAQPTMRRALKFVLHPAAAQSIRHEVGRLMRIESAAIDFRHIARLMDILPFDPPCLVYEYIPGDSLATVLQQSNGPVAPDLAVALTDQVLAGLIEIHNAGLIHRDLHPGNIKIVGRPDGLLVKILDFGLAYAYAAIDETNSPLSGLSIEPTHPWAEPAYLRGSGLPDVRTDVYGAGALLWTLLSGHRGFPPGQALPELAPTISAPLLEVVRCACVVPRAARYAGAMEMREALERAARKRPAPWPWRRS